MESSKLLILGLRDPMMNLLHNQEKVGEKQNENTPHSLSPGGIVRRNYFSNFDGIQPLLTCGGSGKHCFTYPFLFICLTEYFRCVFGEMFKGKPILSGTSDLNQAHIIFNLVGSPTEENMPGWSSLPGCEGVRTFQPKRGNLDEVFRE